MSTPAGAARGQSNIIGVVLLLGITLTAATGIVVLGSTALEETTSTMRSDRASLAMTQFDSETSLVAHGGTDVATLELPDSGGSDATIGVDPDAGWINITVRNTSTGAVEERLLNVSLGAVVYEDDQKRIAYQGGGVWRLEDNASTMVAPPEFHYQGKTLTLPLVLVRGNGSLDGTVRIKQDGPVNGVFPDESAGQTNPLTEGKIVVVVHSKYYQAWGTFFETRTQGDVVLDHDAETVEITLTTPSQVQSVKSAALATSGGDELQLSGGGNFPAFTDSYNSSVGPYSVSKSMNGTVTTAGSAKVGGNARVEGNLRSGGKVTLEGTANVTGDVFWTTQKDISGAAQFDSIQQIDGVEGVDDVNALVQSKIDTLSNDTNNDNGATTAIDESTDRLQFTGGSVTISASSSVQDFYLDKIDVQNKDITIETNGNEVEIALENDISLDQSSNITVKGTGVVRFYLQSDFQMQKGSTVFVPGDKSYRLWIYAGGGGDNSDFDIQASQGSPVRFVGVIYAPTTESQVQIKHAEVFGAVVAGKVKLDTGGAIHYDQNLKTKDPTGGKSTVPITYLHVSTTNVTVTSP